MWYHEDGILLDRLINQILSYYLGKYYCQPAANEEDNCNLSHPNSGHQGCPAPQPHWTHTSCAKRVCKWCGWIIECSMVVSPIIHAPLCLVGRLVWVINWAIGGATRGDGWVAIPAHPFFFLSPIGFLRLKSAPQSQITVLHSKSNMGFASSWTSRRGTRGMDRVPFDATGHYTSLSMHVPFK